MLRRRAMAFGLVHIACCAAAPLAGANDFPSIIVLDGSGSMWGSLGSSTTPKIEAVRSSIGSLAAMASPDKRLSLFAFGHRRRGDCSDVEAVTAITDSQSVLSKIASVEPKGKGPLALAVEQAAKALPEGDAGEVIVLHDGADNCQRDICAAVREATSARPAVKFRFIGLALPRPDALKHACLAEIDNVTIVQADTTEALSAALRAALPAAATPSAENKAVAREAPVLVTAALTDGGAALDIPLRWRIFKSGEQAPIAQSTSAAFSGELPPGDYEAETAVDLAVQRVKFSVDENGKGRAALSLNAGIAELQSAAPRPELMSVYRSEQTDSGSAFWRPILAEVAMRRAFYLPAGDYRLRLTIQGSDADIPFKITAGETASVALPPAPAEISVEIAAPLQVEGATSVAAADQTAVISVLGENSAAPGTPREILRAASDRARFFLPPGKYEISAKTGESEARQTVVLEPGNRQSVVLAPSMSVLEFESIGSRSGTLSGQDKPAIDIVAMEQASRAVPKRLYASNGKISLPPGRYRLSAKVGDANVVSTSDITLAPAVPARVTFNLSAGQARLALAQTTQTGASAPIWRIAREDGTIIWRGVARRPSVILSPGQYTAIASLRTANFAAKFEIRDGETTDVDVAGQ